MNLDAIDGISVNDAIDEYDKFDEFDAIIDFDDFTVDFDDKDAIDD